MRNFTLTWHHSPYYGSTLSRERFNRNSVLWPFCLRFSDDAVLAFMQIACHVGSPSYRLSSCGKLIARSATYTGV